MIDLDMKVIEKAVKYYFSGYSAKEAIRKAINENGGELNE